MRIKENSFCAVFISVPNVQAFDFYLSTNTKILKNNPFFINQIIYSFTYPGFNKQ